MRDILDVLNLGVAFLRSSCVIYIYIYANMRVKQWHSA